MILYVLLIMTVWLSAGQAFAEPLKFDRSINKEPVYETKAPKYGLLAFGPDGKDRVWLVLDGDVLYVDRNGNGDLTEPGERIAAEKKEGRNPETDGYSFDVGDLAVGGRTHKGLTVYVMPLKRYETTFADRADVKAVLAKDPKALTVMIRVDVEVPGMKGSGLGGRIAFSTGLVDLEGVMQFADTPDAAPAVHLGGPLQITFYGDRPALRVGRQTSLYLVVGTPGQGPGTFAGIEYQDTIPKDAWPVAELILPAAKGDQPDAEKIELKERC